MTLIIVETMIAAMQASTWDQTRRRIKTLEHLFDQTGQFKKFV